jgi:cytochrome b6-f complex iron-sulfur subunit
MIPLLRTIFGVVLGGLLSRVAGMLARFHATPQKKMPRRSFVRNAALGAVVVILAELGAGFVRFFWPNKTGAFGSTITVPASVIPPVNGTPYTNIPGKFYIVHTQDGLMALYWKCVHLGCTVPWVESEHDFHCPCHGSVYQYDGVRIAGPAPRPLDYMQLTVDPSGEILVNTGKIMTREKYEPSQATPYNA